MLDFHLKLWFKSFNQITVFQETLRQLKGKWRPVIVCTSVTWMGQNWFGAVYE